MQIEIDEKKGIAWFRVFFVVLSAIISGVAAFIGQPFIRGNADAINAVVTIFSIFSGFLMAVISLMVEPYLKLSKNSLQTYLAEKSILRKMLRQCIIFYFLIITLAISVILLILPQKSSFLLVWLERLFIFFATAVFFSSLLMPSAIIKVQIDRIKAEKK